MGVFNGHIKNNILNEVYFGETEGIQKLFTQFCIIRDKYKDKKNANLKINMDTDLIKFNEMVAQEFGFKQFELSISFSNIPNAYTFTIGTRFDDNNLSKDLTATNKGFKFKNKHIIVVFITSGLFLNKEMTNREVFAILLHEIGHNFNTAISDFSNSLVGTAKILKMIAIVLNVIYGNAGLGVFQYMSNTSDFTMLIAAIQRALKDENLFSYTITIYKYISAGIEAVATEILGLASVLLAPLMTVLQVLGLNIDIIKMLGLEKNYHDEKLSDNFATMYGFGVDLSTALKKLDFTSPSKIQTAAKKIPILSHYLDFFETISFALTSQLDEHPALLSRIKAQIIYLEKELNSGNCTTGVKKLIEKDIKELETIIDEYGKVYNKIDPRSLKKAYQLTMYKMYGGDIKDKLLSKANDTWQQAENRFSKINLK